MISRLGFDALSALTLAVTALMGAYTPVYLAKRDRLGGGSGRSLTFILGNLFSAGVMVSAGFCHLLGESLRQMKINTRFPLPTFLCGLGFMLTLVADAVAATASGHRAHAHGHAHGDDGVADPEKALAPGVNKRLYKHSSQEEEQRLLPNGRFSTDGPPDRNGRASRGGSVHGGSGSAAGGQQQQQEGVALCVLPPHPHHLGENQLHRHARGGGTPTAGDDRPPSPFYAAGGSAAAAAQHERCFTLEDGHGELAAAAAGAGGAAAGGSRAGSALGGSRSGSGLGGGGSGAYTPTGAGLHHSRGESLQLDSPVGRSEEVSLQALAAGQAAGGGRGAVSFITAVLMGVALCFHSLLEGAAMGAQETLTNSLHIFIAIVSHKGLAAYALGSSIVDTGVSMQQFWSVVLPFTFASPVGIFIGYIISDLATGAGAAAISALASGTFLYVAFMEVIPKEMRDPSHIVPKLGMLLLGFAMMSLLAVWA